jgi:hypothetical protein
MMSYDFKDLNDSRKELLNIDCDIDLSNKGNSQVQLNAIFEETIETNASTNDDNGSIATISHDVGDCHTIATIDHEMKNGIIKNEDENNNHNINDDFKNDNEMKIGIIKNEDDNNNHNNKDDYKNDTNVKSIYTLEVPSNENLDEETLFVDLSGNMDIIPGCTDNMDIRLSDCSDNMDIIPGCTDNMDIRLPLGLSRCSDNMDIIPGCSDKSDDDALDALVSISFPVTPTKTRRSIGDIDADLIDDVYTLPRTSVKEIFREGTSIRSSGYSENKQDNLSQKTLPYYSDSEESTGAGDNEGEEEGGGLVEIVLTSQ